MRILPWSLGCSRRLHTTLSIRQFVPNFYQCRVHFLGAPASGSLIVCASQSRHLLSFGLDNERCVPSTP